VNISVRRADGHATIDISGHIDISTSPQLRSICMDLARQRTPKLLFNLSEVNYIDSSGVATLVEALQRLGDYDGKLAIFGLSDRAREVFDIANLTGVFELYETEEEALGKM